MAVSLIYYCLAYGKPSENTYSRWCKVVRNGESERYERYIAVVSMMAHKPEDCDKYLECIEAVEQGRISEEWAGINDTVLHITPEYIQVDIEVCDDWIDQPEGRFPHEVWKKVLRTWKEFLQMPASSQLTMEVQL